MRPADPERIYTPPVDETAGLGLFEAQRLAAPDVADDRATVRPVARVVVQGGSQAGRERAEPTMPKNRGRVYAIIQAHGPLTREGIAAVLSGVSPAPATVCNGVNARVRELVLAKLVRVQGYDRDGRGMLEAVPTPRED